jgi:hypothetical protein
MTDSLCAYRRILLRPRLLILFGLQTVSLMWQKG